MADLPIMFSAPMVRAHLAGRKTMTRRLAMTSRKINEESGPGFYRSRTKIIESHWQRVKPGDLMWVRERTMCVAARDGEIKVRYDADAFEPGIWLPFPDRLRFKPEVGKRLSMGCYREASRITDVVTATKIERLQEITAEDAVAEGIAKNPAQQNGSWMVYPEGNSAAGYVHPEDSFRSLWDGLNAERGFGWNTNPEVVALTFTVRHHNIDACAERAGESQ